MRTAAESISAQLIIILCCYYHFFYYDFCYFYRNYCVLYRPAAAAVIVLFKSGSGRNSTHDDAYNRRFFIRTSRLPKCRRVWPTSVTHTQAQPSSCSVYIPILYAFPLFIATIAYFFLFLSSSSPPTHPPPPPPPHHRIQRFRRAIVFVAYIVPLYIIVISLQE